VAVSGVFRIYGIAPPAPDPFTEFPGIQARPQRPLADLAIEELHLVE
jgi:hypothetical protein